MRKETCSIVSCDIKMLCWMSNTCLSEVFLLQGFKFLNFTFTVYYLITSSAAQCLGAPQHLHEHFNFQVSTNNLVALQPWGTSSYVANRWKFWKVFVKVWKSISCSSLHSTTQDSTVISWLWAVMRQRRRTSFVSEINKHTHTHTHTHTHIYIYIYIYANA